MMMDLRHARTFVTVAELGTVSKAAQHLRIAQPALSRQINALEQELGLKLFDRVGRGLVLSAEGEQLLTACRGLLSYAQSLGEQAQTLRRGDTGILKVAASPQYIEGVLVDFLPKYAERFPAVQVRLTEAAGWSGIQSLLDRGEIHLAQGLASAIEPNNVRFASRGLGFVEQRAVWSPTLKFAAKGTVAIEHLASVPLLLLDTGYFFRQSFDAACRITKVRPSLVFESRTPHTLLTMAERGHGVAIIPSTMRTDRYRLKVASVTHRGKTLREPLSIFWDMRRSLPRYATAFCEMLEAYSQAVGGKAKQDRARTKTRRKGSR
jgi:DNA-binding transcriptional LysR family regulator